MLSLDLCENVCSLIDLAVHFDWTIYSCRNSVLLLAWDVEGCNSFSHTAWTGVRNSLKLQVFCGSVCRSMLMFWQVCSVGRRAAEISPTYFLLQLVCSLLLIQLYSHREQKITWHWFRILSCNSLKFFFFLFL